MSYARVEFPALLARDELSQSDVERVEVRYGATEFAQAAQLLCDRPHPLAFAPSLVSE